MAARDIDTSNFGRASKATTSPPDPAASGSRRMRLNARAATRPAELSARAASAAAAAPSGGSTIDRALSLLRAERARAAGFESVRGADGTDFVPDPVLQRTSSSAKVVHFQQAFRGVPIFRSAHTVRFAPEGQGADVLGDDVVLTSEVNTAPTLVAEQAVAVAARHLASAAPHSSKDEFGQEATQHPVKLDGFSPKVVAGFPSLPSQPAVVDWVATGPTDAAPPFSKPIPAHLVIFDQPDATRLGWYAVFTREAEFEQYAVIVSADHAPGEILYVRDMMHMMAKARGNVFEFSPGIAANRSMIDFPRPITDYPIMPGAPIAGFPPEWVDTDLTVGNSTIATLNTTSTNLRGTLNGNVVEFDPASGTGDDQKLLNIFYFCNYMHDFLYILGFDEAAGNFQKVNFTHLGVAGDPVRARAHSGVVRGTANMSTAADGTPPVMNMGLVAGPPSRHTAFDSDVVFHEFTHGLTNRLVGGTRQGHTLDAPQSSGMGEGWSDFIALTVQNFFRAQSGQSERVVVGDWVVNRARGIRSNPYSDSYPFTYGNVVTFDRFDDFGNPDPNGLPDEHQTGEVWCAALMMMVRRLRAALGDADGYRLGWQMVVDGLKLTPANPNFLDARDAILLALDHMRDAHRIQIEVHAKARQAALGAFGHFGMGPNARSGDAGVDDINEDVVPIPVAVAAPPPPVA